MAEKREKDPLNFVHQNAILCETIGKEAAHQKLYTKYSINPFRKMHVITGKVNSRYDNEADGEEDPHFIQVIKRANEEPVKKYTVPQTEAQEIGWINTLLIETDREDRRLNFPRENTAITKYMDAAWRSIEQTKNMN